MEEKFKPVSPNENQFWIFIGRTNAEDEVPILWPLDAKNQLIGKNPDAGKDCRQEEKGMTEDEMIGWHHWLNAHEFEQTLGVGDGQGSLPCCSPWGGKELDMTEWLNNNNGWNEVIEIASLRGNHHERWQMGEMMGLSWCFHRAAASSSLELSVLWDHIAVSPRLSGGLLFPGHMVFSNEITYFVHLFCSYLFDSLFCFITDTHI